MKSWIYRGVRTFVQAVVGFLAVNLVAYLTGVDYSDHTALKAVIISLGGSALAAGLAAMMNLHEDDVGVKDKLE
ncbi:MAG: hypothetical protein LIO74_08780 [Ruminococcus sp.]|nr:hypothetical protein [Ruminococcus sp.]